MRKKGKEETNTDNMTLTGMLTSRINARLPQVHAAYEM
jgi:hypothetical protein